MWVVEKPEKELFHAVAIYQRSEVLRHPSDFMGPMDPLLLSIHHVELSAVVLLCSTETPSKNSTSHASPLGGRSSSHCHRPGRSVIRAKRVGRVGRGDQRSPSGGPGSSETRCVQLLRMDDPWVLWFGKVPLGAKNMACPYSLISIYKTEDEALQLRLQVQGDSTLAFISCVPSKNLRNIHLPW